MGWSAIRDVLKANPKDSPYGIRSKDIDLIRAELNKDYDKKQLIDDLCIGYCEGVDNEACKLAKALTALLDYSESEIKQIYDIILYRYIQIDDLNQDNFMKLCCKYIKQLKSYHVYIPCASFKSIAEKKRMDGQYFRNKCRHGSDF